MSGVAAQAAARYEAAERHMRAAADAYAAIGDRLAGLRVTATLGMMHTFHGRPRDGIAIIEPALEAARDLQQEPEAIALMGALARSYLFADDYARALELIDQVLVDAERIDDISIITDGVLTKGTTLLYSARYREGLVLLAGGLQLAETHGFVASQLRARLNISFLQLPDDPRLARATAMVGLDQARRMGNRRLGDADGRQCRRCAVPAGRLGRCPGQFRPAARRSLGLRVRRGRSGRYPAVHQRPARR